MGNFRSEVMFGARFNCISTDKEIAVDAKDIEWYVWPNKLASGVDFYEILMQVKCSECGHVHEYRKIGRKADCSRVD